jgi:CheY-like chemotaxis protein
MPAAKKDRIEMQSPDLAFGPNILLVEDNPGDVRLTREAMKESQSNCVLNVVGDGEEAIMYLNNNGQYAAATRPDLILLDLNLPKISGKEVLQRIKKMDDIKSIPVIVLTTSTAQEDIVSSYELHANCYVSKPTDLDDFISAIRQIESFWLSLARLPNS